MSKRPAHLFISEDGNLFDCRVEDWSRKAPLRSGFAGHVQTIDTVAQLKAALRSGEYTSLGCYQLYFVTSDGAALSFDSVLENIGSVMDSIANDIRDGWKVCAVSINYEDAELRCDHSDKRIPSSYGDDETEDAI